MNNVNKSAMGDAMAEALKNARACLLSQMKPDGYWEGELSSSALSTAVAVFALAQVDGRKHRGLIERGIAWLATNVNDDGGWGDTPESDSNLSTTLLCWCALALPEARREPGVARAAETYIERTAGGLVPDQIAAAILTAYGQDRTFSAPILTMCALAGRLGPLPAAWNRVPRLPYELALAPRALFGWLNLSVVSYAIPALVAMGTTRQRNSTAGQSLLGRLATARGLAMTDRMQPESGGFLEAIPLTSFVVMALANCGEKDSGIVRRGVAFIESTVRADGAWPIDTNLATWVTTLAVNALTAESAKEILSEERRLRIRNWLIERQYTRRHPFTNAKPGGWSWTYLSGGAPDADDTSGAVLALGTLGVIDERTKDAAMGGISWLLDLQNGDGGFPTFCRGWGRLPFDMSSPDITAHAVRAFEMWYDKCDGRMRARLDGATARAIEYLAATQRADGAWIPLWFGNQRAERMENPVYGTARVVTALAGMTRSRSPRADALAERGIKWLAGNQNSDGGWGAMRGVPSSVEETALAVAALAARGPKEPLTKGIEWLLNATDRGTRFPPAPIGLYFARLWYHEKLYPLVFTLSALSAIPRLEGQR